MISSNNGMWRLALTSPWIWAGVSLVCGGGKMFGVEGEQPPAGAVSVTWEGGWVDCVVGECCPAAHGLALVACSCVASCYARKFLALVGLQEYGAQR